MKDNTKARFRLRSIFLFVNLTVLFLPLFGVIFFRFYENQLVKQTESELISQAAVFSAIYIEYVKAEMDGVSLDYGMPLASPLALAAKESVEYYTPIAPQADLFSGDIYPPRPDGFLPEEGLGPDLMPSSPATMLAEANSGRLLNLPELNTDLAFDLSLDEIFAQPDAPAGEPSRLDSFAAAPAVPETELGGVTGSNEEDALIVTGSRVRARTALDNAVSVDVIDVEELARTPSLSISDALLAAEENFADENMVIVQNRVARRAGEKMLPIIVEAQKTTLSGIKILDYNGVAIAGRNEIGLNFSLLPEIAGALAGDYTSLMRERISDEPPPALASLSRGTGVRLFVAFPIIENERIWGVVYLSRTPQNILKHIYDNKENMTLIGLSLLGVTLLLALLTSYTVSKPLYRLIDRVKRFTEGEQEAIEPMTSPGVKEIELLSESFSNMAYSLNNRAHYIREFALSVSHEFKTPITSIQGSAELLLEHIDDMDADKKQKFLSNIIIDSDRLKRLINRLLEMAKADNMKPDNENSSLITSLKTLKERYNDLKIKVKFNSNRDYSVLLAKENLETILINIFDNAMQNGASNIHVTTVEHYGFVTLIIQDDGDGISAANREKIFDSFFTTKRENGGTGLGLGIVKSILEAHNGSISLGDSEKGACFEVMLPISIDQAE